MRQAAPLGTRRRADTLRRDARAADFLLGNFQRRNRRPAPQNPRRRSRGRRETRGTAMAPEVSVTFDEWLKWVFDHPVVAGGEKEWWWHLPDEDEGGRW